MAISEKHAGFLVRFTAHEPVSATQARAATSR